MAGLPLQGDSAPWRRDVMRFVRV